jgi:NlpC/P60 family putative phage cell wall peptidase
MATDPAVIVTAARAWIGTPYIHQASLKGVGCDCLGLLRGVWREVVGPEPEALPPYSPDWAEATGRETMYETLSRYLRELPVDPIRCGAEAKLGTIVLFRMIQDGPAKHCGILAEKDGAPSLIHARQNKRVSEETFTMAWRRKTAFAFEVP